MEEFKRAYFKMLTYSKIKEILPHAVYNRKEKKFDLYLDVKMKEEITVGFGATSPPTRPTNCFSDWDTSI